jgi:acyl carrier protein
MNNVEATITRYLLDNPLAGSDRREIAPDEPLIRSGVLDSVGLLQLAFFVEEQFGVKVADGELIPGNFETLRDISAYIERKQASP